MNLEVGDAFLLRNFGFSGASPHYHIVVHITSRREVIVVYSTTSLQKAYRACRRDEYDLSPHEEPETYVEITPQQCPLFSELSAVNCNKVQMKQESHYVEGADFKKYDVKLDQTVIERIKNGIRHSGTVPQRIINALDQ